MSVIAIDIGSQFVDLALSHEGSTATFKHPLGATDAATAILEAYDHAVTEMGTVSTMVREVRIGSTGAINALLGRTGSRVALVTTNGFADTLYLGRQNRRNLYDPIARLATPAFLVAPDDIHEVEGRFDTYGREVAPLSERDLTEILVKLENDPIDSIAVCFVNAHCNPQHEISCRDVINNSFSDVPVILSHQVDPHPREFERTVSTCLEAWLYPIWAETLSRLNAGLRAREFFGTLQFADGTGMLLTEEQASIKSSALLISGPAATARQAATLALSTGEPAAILIDIGSTTTDIALIRDGETALLRQAEIANVPIRQAMLDIQSVALGGLAKPKPDGIGGIVFDRTDTDGSASLSDVLAWLGRIRIGDDPALAGRIEQFAAAAGMDTDSAARSVAVAAEQNVAAAILGYAVKRNVDPSRTVLITTGGLGGVLGAGIAAILGIKKLLIPTAPAVAGALGMLTMSQNVSVRARIGLDAIALGADGLRTELHRLRRLLPASAEDGSLERLTVEMAATPFMHPFDVIIDCPEAHSHALLPFFEEQYAARFGIRPPPGKGYVFAMTLSRISAGVNRDQVTPEMPERRQGMIRLDGGTLWVPEGWHLSGCKGGIQMRRNSS